MSLREKNPSGRQWSPDMSIGGVSGQGKFSIWGRMLERYHRRQESLSILECLLSRSGPLQLCHKVTPIRIL
jgi:hypothetical protein